MSSPTVLYLSHGGGPLPLLGDPAHQQMVDTLAQIAKLLPKPKVIVVFSAHWEADEVTITHSEKPELIYDYSGFPDAAYDLSYPASGQPKLAEKVRNAFEKAGIRAHLDENRGFDHGLFVPLTLLFPQANIPCIQVSLLKNLSAKQHLALGEALKGLFDDETLVIGSGFSFHNMRAFFAKESAESTVKNRAFEQWLQQTCSDEGITEAERYQRLKDWESAPHARYCHPREEHLLPLHVCYGLMQRPCDEVFEVTILNKLASMYLWHSR